MQVDLDTNVCSGFGLCVFLPEAGAHKACVVWENGHGGVLHGVLVDMDTFGLTKDPRLFWSDGHWGENDDCGLLAAKTGGCVLVTRGDTIICVKLLECDEPVETLSCPGRKGPIAVSEALSVVAVMYRNLIRLHNDGTWQVTLQVRLGPGFHWGVDFSGTGAHLAVGRMDSLHVFDARTGGVVNCMPWRNIWPVVAWMPDSSWASLMPATNMVAVNGCAHVGTGHFPRALASTVLGVLVVRSMTGLTMHVPPDQVRKSTMSPVRLAWMTAVVARKE